MSWKPLFSRFLNADPQRLHFAAHSHHPWPDVTRDAHLEWWELSARLMDDKWDLVFEQVIPGLRARLATMLSLPDSGTLVFAPNTHELVSRVFSCLAPPVRIVTSDAEFHSFDRQSRRWEEAGVAIVNRVAAEPFGTFEERFAAAAVTDSPDLIYLSQVFFDSGFTVSSLPTITAAIGADPLVVIDGYHGFMALPTDLGPLADRAFYLAGGYKYAMAGEGACFMHCPSGFGERPVDTGWYAGFSDLTDRGETVGYGSGGNRFWGATFDPSGLFRLSAVLEMADREGLTPAVIHDHAAGLQSLFLEMTPPPGELLPPTPFGRGNFLTFRTERAGAISRALHEHQVITDYRGDRLRIGFGIYHDPADVERLAERLLEASNR